MKNTITYLTIVVFFTAYFLLQNNNSAAASPLSKGGFITSNAPTLLAELSAPVANNGNKSPHSQPMNKKDKPLEPAIRDAVRELVNTSHDGLVEEKTDKGVVIKLKGRFRTAPVATVDEKGEVTIRDYTAPPVE